MKRKALEKTSPVCCPKLSKKKKGYFATSQLHLLKDETVIEIDLYLQERGKVELQFRYFASKKNMQYEILDKTGKWRQRKLDGSDAFSLNGIEISFLQEQMVQEYFKGYGISDIGANNQVNSFERMCNYEKREIALLNKKQKIKMIMEQVDKIEIPVDFDDWLLKRQGGDYIFKKNGIGRCSSCGKEIELGKKGKDGERIECPYCNVKAVVQTRKKDMIEKIQAVLVQRIHETKIVIRHFGVELSKKYKRVKKVERVRLIVDKETNQMKIYYHYYDNLWGEATNGFVMGAGYCYPDTIDLLKETCYKTSMAICLAKLGVKANYNALMRYNDSDRGALEYLAKMGLYRLVEQLSDGPWLDEKYLKQGRTATEVLDLDMQRIQRFKKENGDTNMLDWLKYEAETQEKIPKDTMDFLIKNKLKRYELSFCLGNTTVVKSINYIKKQMGKKTVKNTIGLWQDYLNMARQFGMNLRDSIIFFPKDLIARHDQYVVRINEERNQKRDAEVDREYHEISERYQELSQKYQYQNEKYVIVVPKRASDITREGRRLHHCVGSESYLSGMAKGIADIVFVRDVNTIDTPFYTVEIKDNKVVQFYSEFNRQPNKQEISRFLKGLEHKLERNVI